MIHISYSQRISVISSRNSEKCKNRLLSSSSAQQQKKKNPIIIVDLVNRQKVFIKIWIIEFNRCRHKKSVSRVREAYRWVIYCAFRCRQASRSFIAWKTKVFFLSTRSILMGVVLRRFRQRVNSLRTRFTRNREREWAREERKRKEKDCCEITRGPPNCCASVIARSLREIARLENILTRRIFAMETRVSCNEQS